ncbi:MAG: MFS transporter [Magnetospirillum sp.]|nr:MFS transporter [Magnetospirillum sp.]
MAASPVPPPSLRLTLTVLAPFAAGYFLSYLYRTVNAVLAPEIGRAIVLDSAAIGLMTGAYFLTFGAFQLPLGLLLDRYGPRRVEAGLLVFAALGAVAFSLADSVPALVGARALVGFGVSACLMAALKANVQWFPAPRLPLMNGIILGCGGLGAVAATAPVQAALAVIDWRGVSAILAGLTLAVAVLILMVAPERRGHATPPPLSVQLAEVGAIFRHPLFRRVAPLSMLSQAQFMAIQGLWAGAWLKDVATLERAEAATGLTVMAAGMAAGFLSWGAIAERLGRIGVPTVTVALAGMAAFWVSGAAMAAGWTGGVAALCLTYGFTGASGTLTYAVLTQAFPPHLAGRVNTSLNLVTFAAAFALQWGLGALIGLWPADGDGRRPLAAFAVAFAVPLALKALAFAWYVMDAPRRPAPPASGPAAAGS